MTRAEAIRILVVEDNPADARLLREGLNETGLPYQMDVVTDGEEASHYLSGAGRWAGALTPHLVLLDLKLPRRDGLAVLAEIKAHPNLKRTPVIVWTSSAAPDDVRKSYDLAANGYVRKPADFKGCVAALQRIVAFWFETAILPPN